MCNASSKHLTNSDSIAVNSLISIFSWTCSWVYRCATDVVLVNNELISLTVLPTGSTNTLPPPPTPTCLHPLMALSLMAFNTPMARCALEPPLLLHKKNNSLRRSSIGPCSHAKSMKVGLHTYARSTSDSMATEVDPEGCFPSHSIAPQAATSFNTMSRAVLQQVDFMTSQSSIFP